MHQIYESCEKLFDVTAFAALIKRKRGEARLTQETLALDIFDDATRKADISRLENGKIQNPQEATVQRLCQALNISAAEMEPIRQPHLSATQLDHIPTLSREELENLALRFEVEHVFDRSDLDLRHVLTKKAEEYRALKTEVDAIPESMRALANLKAAAQEAIARVDLQEVDNLMSMVHAAELEEAAKSAEIRANNALLRGDVDKAFTLLCSAADSFEPVDPLEPARRRILGARSAFPILFNHGHRYGGSGLSKAAEMVRGALSDDLKSTDASLWAKGQNNLALALRNQGIRAEGAAATDLLAQAVTAYRAGLKIHTRDTHPMDWAMTQNNLGNALVNQGTRTEGAAGAALLAQAVNAYRAALDVRTRDTQPLYWATTQNNLGNALREQGSRTKGAAGADLLAQAAAACHAALQVHTRDAYPVDWAMTQNNLGMILKDQGTRTKGAAGAALLTQAVTAFRAALDVRTRDAQPVQWATTQEHIANTERQMAQHDACADPRGALDRARMAVEAALTVFDPSHMSYNHKTATRLRDRIHTDLAAFD